MCSIVASLLAPTRSAPSPPPSTRNSHPLIMDLGRPRGGSLSLVVTAKACIMAWLMKSVMGNAAEAAANGTGGGGVGRGKGASIMARVVLENVLNLLVGMRPVRMGGRVVDVYEVGGGRWGL